MIAAIMSWDGCCGKDTTRSAPFSGPKMGLLAQMGGEITHAVTSEAVELDSPYFSYL